MLASIPENGYDGQFKSFSFSGADGVLDSPKDYRRVLFKIYSLLIMIFVLLDLEKLRKWFLQRCFILAAYLQCGICGTGRPVQDWTWKAINGCHEMCAEGSDRDMRENADLD